MSGPVIIDWVGEIDIATVLIERRRVDEVLESGLADPLCLDLSGVTFFDSSGLGLLVHVRNSCAQAQIPLTLRGVPAQVRQLLAVTGLLRIFDIDYVHPSTDVDPATLPRHAALPAEPDPAFDRIAQLAARLLDVPTAIVTLVDQNGQVFPGAVGMREPDQSERRSQLSHSLCKHVVARAAELVIPDLSADALFAETPAAVEVRIMSYAGTPITGADGRVIGSLCAIRDVPTKWSEDQLADLRQLADIASAELHAREALRRAVERATRYQAAHRTASVELHDAEGVLGKALADGDDDARQAVAAALARTRAALRSLESA